MRTPAGDGNAGERQRQQRGSDGGQTGGEVPVPGVAPVLGAAAREDVEPQKLPGHEHPPAATQIPTRAGPG